MVEFLNSLWRKDFYDRKFSIPPLSVFFIVFRMIVKMALLITTFTNCGGYGLANPSSIKASSHIDENDPTSSYHAHTDE